MDQATIQILIVVFMVAFLVWWQNRDLRETEWLFGDDLASPLLPDAPAS